MFSFKLVAPTREGYRHMSVGGKYEKGEEKKGEELWKEKIERRKIEGKLKWEGQNKCKMGKNKGRKGVREQ